MNDIQETTLLCPIMAAIKDIRTGGWYDDDAESDDTALVFIGGSDCYVPDNITYLMNTRAIQIARMKIHEKSPADICKKIYGMYNGKKHSEIFDMLLQQSSMYTYAFEQFSKLMSLISNIESYIQKSLQNIDVKLDLSIPDILLPQNIAQANLLQNNEILRAIINKIIEYMSKLDLTSLGIQRIDLPPFTAEPPQITISDEVISFSDEATEADLENIHAAELAIAKKVSVYEKYQCEIVNYVNKVFETLNGKLM